MSLITHFYTTAIFTLTFGLPRIARAEDEPTTTESFLNQIGGVAYNASEPPSLPEVVGNIISVFLSIIGAFLVALLVYGGYLWMNARGNEDQVKKAKEVLSNAIIGLVIILIAWSLTRFIVSRLAAATSGRE